MVYDSGRPRVTFYLHWHVLGDLVVKRPFLTIALPTHPLPHTSRRLDIKHEVGAPAGESVDATSGR